MSTLVIHYYITNHPKLCALNQPLFYYCSQVCVSTGGSCAVRRYTDGVEGVSRLVGLGWPNLYIWLSGWYWLLVGAVGEGKSTCATTF